MLKTRYFLAKKAKKGGVPFRPEPFFKIFGSKMLETCSRLRLANLKPSEGEVKTS
jgi:hypothetical protein